MTVYVDTAWLVALIDPADDLHDAALGLARDLAAKGSDLLTTDAVIFELANYFARSPLRSETSGWIDRIRSADGWEVAPLSASLVRRAERRYAQFRDEAWSLTACVGMELMAERGIEEAATTDVGFRQAGFRLLLRRR